MRIINQDRNFSFEFDGAIISVQGTGVYAQVDGGVHCIGVYKSKDRASEVFCNIHKEDRLMNALFCNLDISEEEQKELSRRVRAGDIHFIQDSRKSKIEFDIINSVYLMPLS